MKVKHKWFGSTGVAEGMASNGIDVLVRWDHPGTLLNYRIQPHNLVFIVPAGSRRTKPGELAAHEFLAKRPGSIICVCGYLKETPMHGYSEPQPRAFNPTAGTLSDVRRHADQKPHTARPDAFGRCFECGYAVAEPFHDTRDR